MCAVLFDWYNAEKQDGEKMGRFIHRQGFAAVLGRFKEDPRTAELLVKRNLKMVFDPYIETDLLPAD